MRLQSTFQLSVTFQLQIIQLDEISCMIHPVLLLNCFTGNSIPREVTKEDKIISNIRYVSLTHHLVHLVAIISRNILN